MMGETCGGAGGGGAGGGGSGGCGGELIGVAQEADNGCCCPSTLGTPAKCHTVGSEACGPYELRSDGACDPGTTIICPCSASGVGTAAGGVNPVEMFVLFLALGLAVFRAMRRRFA